MSDNYIALRETYRRSLFAATQHLCGMKDINPHTHGNAIKALQAPSKRKLIVLPRGSMKCVGPSSFVLSPTGMFKTIQDIKVNDSIASWKDGHMVTSTVVGKEFQLNREMLRIKFRSGVTLECSTNHPLLTIAGFVEASELSVGKRIAHWAGKVIDEGINAPSGHPWLLGMMIGDGCTSKKACSVDIWHEPILKRTKESCELAGLSLSKRQNKGTYGLLGGREFLNQYALSDKTSWTKTIPSIVFEWSLKDRREFIAAYLSCDGHANKLGKVSLCTVSHDMAWQMHALLKTIGVFSTVSYLDYPDRSFYTVAILDNVSIKNLLQCPTVMKKREPKIPSQDGFYRSVPREWRKVAMIPKAKSRGIRIDNKYDTSFKKFRPLAKELGLEWACTDEIVWDQIESIQPYTGTAIDIEVKDTHTFLANGIVTHNTSLCSVSYPIWLLINNPNLRIMLDSSVYTNSEMRVREIKDHMQTEYFQMLFGDYRGSLWNQGEIIIKPRTKVVKEPSVFASGIGASKTGVHADVIIADDLNDDKNSMTREGLEKVYRHYSLYTSILEPNGILVVVGTRWAAGDVIGRILQNEINWADYNPDAIKHVPRE